MPRPYVARTSSVPSRSFPVPDGLDGVRVDAALAKLLGFSRTFAAEVAESGGVRLDGRALGKSDKLRADSWLDVDWQERREPEIVPIAVPDLGIVYDDDDIVVVDKPAGVAAHPSVGWEGPTVLGALAAGGYRIATTGAAERQGVVHRLDVGTSGLMVVAKASAPMPRSSARSRSARSRRSTTPSCRVTPIRSPARSTRRSGGTLRTHGSSP